MIPIQEAGIEILGDTPKNLYFFCGCEYGVKRKYLEHLAEHYGSKVEAESVDAALSSFNKKSLVAPKNSLYIVRYDSDFLTELNQKSKSILDSRIPGTLVCVYEDESSFKKLDKQFPENVVRFDNLTRSMISKYLLSDFPDISEAHVKYVAAFCTDYYHGYQICRLVENSTKSLDDIGKEEFLHAFGLSRTSSEDQFKVAIASKNFSASTAIVDSFDEDLNYLINCICMTMVEIEKVKCSRRVESDISSYVSKWTIQDIYYMFNHAYNEIVRLRKQSGNVYDSLMYLLSMLRFKSIPALEDVM